MTDVVAPRRDGLAGTVTYRCAGCSELIQGEGAPLLADEAGPLGERELTASTLAYHQECYGKGMTDGS